MSISNDVNKKVCCFSNLENFPQKNVFKIDIPRKRFWYGEDIILKDTFIELFRIFIFE